MPKSRTILSLVAVPLLAFLIACSSGDDDDSSSTSDGGDQPAATQPSDGGGNGDSSNDGDSTDSSTDGNGDSTDNVANDEVLQNCPELLAFASAAAQGAFGGANPAPSTLEEDLELTAGYFQELAANSPDEIRADMQIIADAFGQFFQTLEELEIDFSDPSSFATLDADAVAQLEAASSAVDTPEVNAAVENVQAYFERECS